MTSIAQWDVDANPSARLHDGIAFLVDLRSNLSSGLDTRMAALALTRVAATASARGLCPRSSGAGVAPVFAFAPQASGPTGARLLKGNVASLRSPPCEIVGALDAVIGGP